MPPGYSLEAHRKRLTEQPRQARAAELSQASFLKRKRIEFEINREVNQLLNKAKLKPGRGWRVLWTL
jgi:hypothetical protein